MPRRNIRAKTPRRHHRRPEVQRTRRRAGDTKIVRSSVGSIVRPVGMCGKKLKFDTEENAAIALTQARAAHQGSGRVEKRWYACDKCAGFHLTSRESWHEFPGN